jgi:hypothetical protein
LKCGGCRPDACRPRRLPVMREEPLPCSVAKSMALLGRIPAQVRRTVHEMHRLDGCPWSEGVAGGARSGQSSGADGTAQPAMGEAALPPLPSARPTHDQATLPSNTARDESRDTPPVAGGVPAPNQAEKRTPALRVMRGVSLDPVGLADEPHLRCPWWWWRLPLAQRAGGLRKQADSAARLAAEDTAVQRGAAITQRPPQPAGAAAREPDLLGHRPRSSAPRRPQYLAGIPPPMGRTLYPGKPLVNP